MKKIEKDEKPENKTVRKTTKKTAVKSTANRVKIKELNVSGADIAYVIGVTTAAITQMEQTNTIHRNEDGSFNLVESVSNYCRNLRERKVGNSKSDVDKETAIWKLQNIKQKNRDWRMQRDREVALEITRTLTNAMLTFREQAKMNPALVEAINAMIASIGSVNVDSISLAVEGEETEDDE